MRLPWMALAVGLMTTPSFAEEKTALVVIREAGAETCPDAVQLGAHVNAIVARDVVGAGRGEDSAWIEVTMRREGEGYAATVRTYGGSVGQRELSDAGPGCGALGEAVAVSLALMWTSQEDAAKSPEPGLETGETEAGEAGEAAEPPTPAPPAEPASTKRASRRRAPPRAPEEPWLGMGVDAFLGVALAVLEHPTPSAELGVRADLGKRASFGVVAGATGPDRIELDEGNVDLSFFYVAVRACAGVIDAQLRVSLCLRPGLGSLRGAGTDFEQSWQRRHLEPSIGVGVEVRGPIARAVGWAAELLASTPLERHGFSVVGAEGERTVFTSPSVGLWALVGISWEAY